jgi:hypothetical protein
VISLSSFVRRPPCSRWAPVLLGILVSGCGRNDVQVYQVAKEQPQQVAGQPTGMPPGHPPTSAAAPPALQWKLPAGWQESPPGEMRVASFKVQGKNGKQADVSVVPLPGLVGRDLENVNRWRESVGMPPVAEEELSKLAQPVQVAGQPGQLFEQAGSSPGSGDKTRILAAISRRDGVPWFFKMTGDDALVAEQKPAFVEFLKTLTFEPAGASAQLPPSHPPIGGGMMPPGQPPAPAGASTQSKPVWQVPTGWQETAAGQFLVAKFLVKGAGDDQAAINVSASAGDGGGLVENVNRWRAQLGLERLAEGAVNKLVTPLDVGAGKAALVEMAGADPQSGQKTRLVGAVVAQGSQTWFYKLMGSEPLVQREKDAFSRFVQTAKYPNVP